jgi:hypothetical protein
MGGEWSASRLDHALAPGKGSPVQRTQNNAELRWPLQVDTWERRGDRKTIAQRERERTQCVPCIVRRETVRFRPQKYRNGGQLWAVNVFSYTIHAQTVGHRAPPCSFHLFPPPTVTFPKLSVTSCPLHLLYRRLGRPHRRSGGRG